MADVSVKMGVSGIGQFKQGMTQAAANIRSVDAALKLNEKQLKLTGDAETYMQQKTMLLSTKLNAQKAAVANADGALRQMKANGVDPLSAAYQNMQAKMLDAQAAMMETQAAIEGVGQAGQDAIKSTDNLAQSVQGINKKMSLEQVQNGIKGITDAMSAAAKKAIEMGNSIKESILESARWADDAATMAQMYEIPLDQYLRMQALVETGMDTSVEAILGAQQKMKKGIGKESKETMDTLKKLGLVVTEYGGKVSEGFDKMLYDDPEKMFWEAGKAIMGMADATEKEAAAQQVFGKSWRELVPLFTEFGSQEEYNAALEKMNVNSEESVEKLAALNDAMSALEHDFNVLKTEVLSSLAPALQTAAEALSNMLRELNAYLQTDEGKEKLEAMGEALKGIVENITNIDPEAAVDAFAGAIDKITSAFTWIKNNWSAVKTGLMALVGAFAALKLATIGINIAGIISGLKGAVGAGASGAGAGAGTGAAGAKATPVVTKAPLRGNPASNSAAIAAAEAGAFGGGGLSAGGVGTGLAGAGTLGVGSLLGGAGIIAAGTMAIAAVVRNLNEAAAEARQVQTDVNRFDDFLTQEAVKTASDLSNAYAGQVKDKRLVIQETVRALYKTSGGNPNSISNPKFMMKWLAENMGGNLLDVFSYTNTSGESRNKLFDMLGMDDNQAAAAAMMLQAAGFRYNDTRLTTEQQTLYEMGRGALEKRERGEANESYTESLGTMIDFFNHSGMFNENGEWTIPGLEEDLAAQAEAAQAMSSAAEVMAGLPEAVAAAVSGVHLDVDVHVGATPNANGLAYVPFDGYLAMLHKGERVMTARENAAGSRSYSSNLYIESMYMNNGTDAEGLAAAMAAQQRRNMSGFGS